jgi:hypothetical protein
VQILKVLAEVWFPAVNEDRAVYGMARQARTIKYRVRLDERASQKAPVGVTDWPHGQST